MSDEAYEIGWEDLPPRTRSGGRPGEWAGRIAPLRARPGQWAVIRECASRKSASVLVTTLRRGNHRGYEFRTRGAKVYGRYLGPDAEGEQ